MSMLTTDSGGFDWSTGQFSGIPGPSTAIADQPVVRTMNRIPDPGEWLASADLGFEPRPYQLDGFHAILSEFRSGRRSTLLVLPTGAGKTVLFGMIAKYVIEAIGGMALVLAHRDELIGQAVAKLDRLRVDSVIEKAEADGLTSLRESSGSILGGPVRCVVGSVQSLRPKRLARWPKDSFKLIITDEAHHAPADSYGPIYSHFADAWHLGVTATADRKDRKNLGSVFETKAYEYPLDRAIRDGYLCRITAKKAAVRVDLRGIRTVGGDFNQGDLEDRISKAMEPLVNATREVIGDRRTIVFTPDVGSAEAFADGLKKVFVEARAVHGKSPDREQLLKDFAEGKFQVLCNCSLLTEGYDHPEVAAIVLARPTKSRSLFCQMIGRGTRIADGKEDVLVVDFDWLLDRHDLMRPVDLFAPEKRPDARTADFVQEILDLGEAGDLMDALSLAEETLDEVDEKARERAEAAAEERRRLKLSVRKQPSRVDWRTFDPLGIKSVSGLMRLDVEETWKSRKVMATEPQIAALVRFGVAEDEARSMSVRAASAHMDALIERSRRGLATYKQVKCLVKAGVDREAALALTFGDASRMIDSLPRRRAS